MMLELVLFTCVMLFLILLLIPSWKGFFVVFFVVSLLILVLWGQHFYVSSQLNYQGSPGDGLGMLVFFLLTTALLLGGFFRYCRWLVQLKIKEVKSRREI